MADGKVVIDTLLDPSGAINGIGKLGKSIMKIGTIGAAAGAAATGALAKSALDSYAEYEQLVGGVETLFKDSADKVQDYASKAYETAGLSANEYMETVTSFSASLLQSLGGDTEKAADVADKAIRDMSDNANKMGTDMSMIQNAYQGFAKQNYTMLDNLKLGYGGTKKEMERLLKDAEKLSGQKFNLDSYADVVEAIHVIQDEMGITETTLQEASGTIEGSTKAMKSAWDNLVTGIADDNADLEDLIEKFIKSVETVGKNIMPRLEIILTGIGSLIERIFPKILDKIPSVIQKVLPKLLETGTNLFIQVFNALSAAIPSLIDMLPGIIETIGESLVKLAPTLLSSVGSILESIMDFVFGELPNLINELTSFIQNLDLSGAGSGFVDNLATNLRENLPILLEAIINLVTEILLFLLEQLPSFVQAGLELIVALAQGILSAIPTLLEKIPQVVVGLVTALLECIPMVLEAGVELLGSLAEAIPQSTDMVCAGMPEMVNGIVDALIDNAPMIADAGVELFTALILNMPKILYELSMAPGKIVWAFIEALSKRWTDIQDAGVDLLKHLWDKIPQMAGEIADAVGELWDYISDAFEDLYDDMFGVGENMTDGLLKGLVSASYDVAGKLTGLSGIVDGVKDFFGIHSPSKLMEDEVGKWLPAGIYVGWKDYGLMDKIKNDLEVGMSNLDTAVAYHQAGTVFDYDAMASSTLEAFGDNGIQIVMDDRELGRAVRGYV